MDTTIIWIQSIIFQQLPAERLVIYGMVVSVFMLFILKLFLGHVPFMSEFLFLFHFFLSSIHLVEVIQ